MLTCHAEVFLILQRQNRLKSRILRLAPFRHLSKIANMIDDLDEVTALQRLMMSLPEAERIEFMSAVFRFGQDCRHNTDAPRNELDSSASQACFDAVDVGTSQCSRSLKSSLA
jgi:hypothetical protein